MKLCGFNELCDCIIYILDHDCNYTLRLPVHVTYVTIWMLNKLQLELLCYREQYLVSYFSYISGPSLAIIREYAWNTKQTLLEYYIKTYTIGKLTC